MSYYSTLVLFMDPGESRVLARVRIPSIGTDLRAVAEELASTAAELAAAGVTAWVASNKLIAQMLGGGRNGCCLISEYPEDRINGCGTWDPTNPAQWISHWGIET